MNKDSKPSWYDELSKQPFGRPQWSIEQQGSDLLRSFSHPIRTGRKIRRLSIQLASLTLLTSLIIVIVVLTRPGENTNNIGIREDQSWNAHNDYSINGVVQWEVFPGGDHLIAGKPAGARWLINKPIAELLDHKVKIVAYHQDTGMVLEELPEMIITEHTAIEINRLVVSVGGAVTKTQFVSEMAMPLAGKWLFQMELDGAPFGEVVLNVQDGE
ncbi:hypothetical protein [Cohnella abietis]|uniref:DUF4871 domain-containing protein n=1 Tax=Cohnella abietis TaxID=2507935 RepID=A0A3T1D7Q0_9BACL|nr:hypothetical protein [Cohnella abietis]BBI34117.1 hypothetical protein KCTCHS21_35160 [Cohnella abietis]